MININEEELQCKICYEFLYETVLCNKCSNAFCQECAINYKKKAKKYGRVDKCPICGSKNFTFQRCEEIDKLIKKRKQKPLQCQHCKRIIFDKEKYEEHIKDCKYQCKFCLLVFEKEDDLLRHIKKNTEELFKALDLMNANGNKVKEPTEEKRKKKKMVKNKTKESIKNTETKNDKKEDEKIENNSDFSKKIVKKKIIKKKKKVAKRKDGANSNTINYIDNNNINDDDLLKNKINKISENKLITERRKVNISTDIKIHNKNLKEMSISNKYLKTSESIKDNNKISKTINPINISNISINKTISSDNLNDNSKMEKSQEEPKKENEDNEKSNRRGEDNFKNNSNKREPEIIFSNSGKKNYNNQIIEEEEK